jgi:acyl transferase domain-containing protein/acyl carrier protein
MKKQVAIIGMSYRFPSTNMTTYWKDLLQGKNLVTTVAEDRWVQPPLLHPDKKHPGTAYTFAAGSIGDIKGFDASFFGISPREAAQMDPQQRLLLELSYEAIENAGLKSQQLKGSNTSVFIGIASADYSYRILDDLAAIDSGVATGTTASIAANRLSYVFDLQGPSMAIDTACSSSMVAFHQAVRSIQSGESAMALAGGVSLHLHPYGFIIFSKASMLSRRGRCQVFDADGDGYVRSEGGGIFLLKDYDQAVADGDRILAVVANTAVNTDGKKSGLTVPKAAAQADLLQRAYQEANIAVDDIDYIEAHGTGTAVGDPIETAALATALGKKRSEHKPLLIGSVKSNLGHLEAASGVAGLVKAVHVLQHRMVPATVGIKTLNPQIDFTGGNLHVVQQNTALPATGPLTVGVNSFGFGGSNAHVILQNPPAAASEPAPTVSTPLPILVSGHTPDALKANAAQVATFLATQAADDFYHASYHSIYRRDWLPHRVLISAHSANDAAEQLRRFSNDEKSTSISVGQHLNHAKGPVWVFSGNGCQWHGMGQALLENREFADAIAEIDALFEPLAGFRLVDELAGKLAEQRVDFTEIAQPALFALQVGVCRMLRAQGITPVAVCGHSVGEVAAAWAAGILSLADAVQVIFHRSRLQGLTKGRGQMTAAGLSVADCQQLLSELQLTHRVCIAGDNSRKAVTLAGDADALSLVEAELERRTIFVRRLALDYAFHSPAMDDIAEPIQHALATIRPKLASIPFYSTVSGQLVRGPELDAHYWWLNIREPVQFKTAMDQLVAAGHSLYVEVGSHAILRSYIQDACQPLGEHKLCIGTGKKFQQDIELVMHAARMCIISGAAVDWSPLFTTPGRHLPFPAYAWQRQDCWLEPTPESQGQLHRTVLHPLLGYRSKHHQPHWQQQLDNQLLPWLGSHHVGDSMIFPGTGYCELALAAAAQWAPGPIIDLENLEIIAPLIFTKDHTKVIQAAISPNDGRFTLHSRDLKADEEPILQFKARIRQKPDAVVYQTICPQQPTRTPDFSRAEHQQLTHELGLQYGDEFSLISHGWRDQHTVLGQYEWPAQIAESAAAYLLYPGALDCAFQLIIQAILTDVSSAQMQREAFTFIPTSVERLRLFRDKGLPQLAEMTLLRRSPHSILASFRLFDADGALIAEITQARFKRTRLRKTAADIQQLHYQWTPMALTAKPAATDLLPQAAQHFTQLAEHLSWQQSRAEFCEELDPLLNELVRRYIQQALQQIASHTDIQQWQLDLSLRHPQLSQYLTRIKAQTALLDAELFNAPDDGLTASQLWRAMLADYPQHFLHIHSIGRVGLHLSALLQQQPLPDDLPVNGSNFPELYIHRLGEQGCRQLQRQVYQLAQTYRHALPPGQKLRCLEISAETPLVMPELSQQLSHHDYSLSFASPTLTYELQELAHQYPHILFSDFATIDTPADVILLHLDMATLADAKAHIEFASRMLADGGLLMVLGQDTPLCSEMLLPFVPSSQLLPNLAYWQQALTQIGLTSQLLPLSSDMTVLLASSHRTPNTDDTQPHLHSASKTESLSLLLMNAGSEPFAQQLQQHIQSHSHCELLHITAQTTRQHLEQVLSKLAPTVQLVYVVPASTDPLSAHAADYTASILEPLTYIHQYLNQHAAANPLWLLTQDVHANQQDTALTAATAWGLARTMRNELQSQLRLMDCHSSLTAADTAHLLIAEMQLASASSQADEDEICFDQHAIRHVARLQTVQTELMAAESTQNYGLDFSLPGQLRHLYWRAQPDRIPAADQILVDVEATGLNFRDVMYALGLLSDEAVENGFAGPTLGLEFAGTIKAVGQDVEGYQIGQRVLGFGPASFSRQVLTQPSAIALIPEHMSAEAAATIPSTFFTAYYALDYLARLQPNETVLIHGAAGGVGIAAIQIAHHLGANVIATASSAEKHDFLRQLGVTHIFDSRSLKFAEQIMHLTENQGVDVVLNSLAGEAIHRNLAVLKPFGRFLELGKRDFYENNQIGLRPFRNNISYFGIDADQLMQYRPALTHQLFTQMMQLFNDGTLFPLPYQSFGTNQIVSAFRYMQQARHIGKIVVNYQNTTLLQALPQQQALRLSATHSYLVTGGMAGFGLKTAQWLAEKGARHLVLLSRRGMDSPDADAIVADFAAQGVAVWAPACDVSDQPQLAQVLTTIRNSMPPLAGIVHAAAVIEDSLLQNLTPAQLRRVLQAKLQGAALLDELTRDDPLQLFVLFSSATTLFGNPGQAAYVAANSYLEALARRRLQQQLPATAVLWGAIDDAGFLARHTEIKSALQKRMGGAALASAQALHQLEQMLCKHQSGVGILELDWQALKRFIPSANAGRFALLRQQQADDGQEQHEQDFTQLLQTLPSTELLSLIIQQLKQLVSGILRAEVSKINEHDSVYDMGLDSLMGVELVVAIENKFGLRFPVMALSESPTIYKLAEKLLSMLQQTAAVNDEEAELKSQIKQIASQHGSHLGAEQLENLVADTKQHAGRMIH